MENSRRGHEKYGIQEPRKRDTIKSVVVFFRLVSEGASNALAVDAEANNMKMTRRRFLGLSGSNEGESNSEVVNFEVENFYGR